MWALITFLISCQAYLSALFLHLPQSKLNEFVFGFSYNSPLIVIQAVIVWLLFSKIRLHNKFINYVGASTLAVYLFHMHPDIKDLYYCYGHDLYANTPTSHAVSLIILFITVFAVAVFMDKLRIYLWSLFSRYIHV